MKELCKHFDDLVSGEKNVCIFTVYLSNGAQKWIDEYIPNCYTKPTFFPKLFCSRKRIETLSKYELVQWIFELFIEKKNVEFKRLWINPQKEFKNEKKLPGKTE